MVLAACPSQEGLFEPPCASPLGPHLSGLPPLRIPSLTAVCFAHGFWCVSGDLPVTWQDRHPSTQHCTHRIMAPQTCPQLISEACDHVTLDGDRGSADRVQCSILRWEITLHHLGGPGVITGSSKKVL